MKLSSALELVRITSGVACSRTAYMRVICTFHEVICSSIAPTCSREIIMIALRGVFEHIHSESDGIIVRACNPPTTHSAIRIDEHIAYSTHN